MSVNLLRLQDYRSVTCITDPKVGLVAYVSVHKLFNNKPSFGATRYAKYASLDDALADAIGLSKLMTYKSVMAGLPYGGAKAVIVQQEGTNKQDVLRSYAKFISQLHKEFVTGADIGISQDDVAFMKTIAPLNIVGTDIDPVAYTIDGLLLAIEKTVNLHFEKQSLEQFSFAIQGAGKIGASLLAALYPQVKKIYISDIDQSRLNAIKKKYPKVEIVDPNNIYSVNADFFSPCAVSHSLNKSTIPMLNCKVILGGANIQLESANIGKQLHKMDILYVPDYVVNAGGLISVTDEFEHNNISHPRIQKKITNIPLQVEKIIEMSKKNNMPTSVVADQMADSVIKKLSLSTEN